MAQSTITALRSGGGKPVRPGLQRLSTSNMCVRRKIVCFSDFDGTIFLQDSGHQLFDNFGCGRTQREALAQDLELGIRSFRAISNELYASLNTTFETGFEVVKTALHIDPHFQTFFEFCGNNDIAFNVISSGLKPMLRRVLDYFLGEEAAKGIDIIANDVKITQTVHGSQWEAQWLHDGDLGHDKALSMKLARNHLEMQAANGTIPIIVFIGDGVSDLPAAREADFLFARRGLRLEEFCIENKIKYFPFDTFADIQVEIMKLAIQDEKETLGYGMPAVYNPRANLWRRASSKNNVSIYSILNPEGQTSGFPWLDNFVESANINTAASTLLTSNEMSLQPIKAN